MSEIVKNALYCSVKESFQKFLDPDQEVYIYFQNLISSFLSTGKKIHEDSSSSFCMKIQTNKQTERQTRGYKPPRRR